MKLLPVKVRVNPALPTPTLEGERLASDGIGLVIEKVTAPEVPPPGAGFATVTEKDPGEAISLAGMLAVSCVLLMNVVDLPEPFTCTVDPLTKPVPLTVSVKLEPPATAEVG